MRVLSGFQPSGHFHLGNYFGSILPNIEFQKESDASFFMVADLHSLTTIRDPEQLRTFTIDNVRDFLACGFDPSHSVLFRQSAIAEHAELAWILSTLTPMGLMERAVSFKDKVERGIDASVGLFTYPILQTADIILYQAEKVPVGKDQKQHIEMARDIAGKFNHAYGDTFVVPEPIVQEGTAIVPGTDGQKMSKSYGNTIPLLGEDSDIKKAIMGIVTDSKDKDDAKDPDTCVIFQIHKLLLDTGAGKDLEAEYKNGLPYGDAKKRLLSDYMDFIAPFKSKKESITVDEAQKVLYDGAAKASEVASETMESVRKAVGLK
jgi:tryptophanyl-tRNA synthetase